MSEKTVSVTKLVKLTYDESKFTDEFMAEFAKHLYPFDSINDHVEHLSWVAVEHYGLPDFIEGYGEPELFGLSAEISDTEVEIQ